MEQKLEGNVIGIGQSRPVGHSDSSVPSLRVIITLVACFLVEFTLGIGYTFGNILPYLTSYIRQSGYTSSADYSSVMWIGETTRIVFSVAMPVLGVVERRLPPRLYLFVGCSVTMGALFGSYWAVQKSFAALLFSYGALLGIGKAILYPAGVSLALKWVPQRKGLVTGLIVAGYGGGAVVWNQVVTNWINPDNLLPDVEVDHDQYFTQPEVLSRVPTSFLLLGAMVCGTQLLCVAAVTFPPTARPTTLHVEGQHARPQTDDTLVKGCPPSMVDCRAEENVKILKTNKLEQSDLQDSPPENSRIEENIFDRPTLLQSDKQKTKNNFDEFTETEYNSGQEKAFQLLTSESGNDGDHSVTSWKINEEHKASDEDSEYRLPLTDLPSVAVETPEIHSQDKQSTDCSAAVRTRSMSEQDQDLTSDTSRQITSLHISSADRKQRIHFVDNSNPQEQHNDSDEQDQQNTALGALPQKGIKRRVVFDRSDRVITDHVPGKLKADASAEETTTVSSPVGNWHSQDYTALEVLRSRTGWTVFLLYLFTELTIIFVVDLYKAYGQTFIHDDHFLAILASCTAVLNALGRPVWGHLADRYGFSMALLTAQALLSIPAGTLLVTERLGRAAFSVWVLVMYIAISGIYSLEPSIIFSLFGPSHFTSNLGLVRLYGVVSSPLSVFVASAAKDAFGWHGIFLVGAACTLIAMLINASLLLHCGPGISFHMRRVLFRL